MEERKLNSTELLRNKRSSGRGLREVKGAMAVTSAKASHLEAIAALTYRDVQAKLKELNLPAKG